MSDAPRGAILLAPLLSLVLVLVLGRPFIGWLRRLGAGQRVRNDGPQRHLEKEGTPTMGGVLIVGAAVAGAALGGAALGLGARLWAMIGVTILFGGIGMADDWLKIKRGRSLGLRARQKLAWQLLGALAFVLALRAAASADDAGAARGPLWIAFWVLAMVAGSNAMNLADGLDGLASGLCVVAALGFGGLALHRGAEGWGLALAMAGSCLGFLWYNRHPARVFMGDVGSLALGAATAAMAAELNSPAVLIGLCLVPFIEELSVIAQVISFQTTGRRIIKMSPIHHHFELSGWSERRVVGSFWAAAVVAAGITCALLW